MADLSICIPTFNRAERLRITLRTLLEELRAEGYEHSVGVCVSDNASEDHTGQILVEIAAEFPSLRYRRNDRNVSFGNNLWNVIELAQSDYVLLLGDDDAVDVKLLAEIASALDAEEPDLLLLNSEPGHRVAASGIAATPGPHRLSGLSRYLADLGPFHATFIGNLVFRRSAFLDISRGSFIGDSAYPHMVPVLDCLRRGEAVFLPVTLIGSDDGHRNWQAMQPIYTAIDLAQIYRWFGLPLTWLGLADRVKLAAFLARSLPRAWRSVASGAVPRDTDNPFRSTRMADVVRIYAGLLFPARSVSRAA